MLHDTSYTKDGRAVIYDDEGTALVSVFEKVEFSGRDSTSILEDLDYIFNWIEEGQVRVPDAILIKTAPVAMTGKNIEVIPVMTSALDEFVEKIMNYGEFTAFEGAPAIKIMGWEEALDHEVLQAHHHFFKTKRRKALEACVEAGDPLNLFKIAS